MFCVDRYLSIGQQDGEGLLRPPRARADQQSENHEGEDK